MDSLNTRLSVLKDTLKQTRYRLIEYENANEKNGALLQEIDNLKKQLAATEIQQQKIVSEVSESTISKPETSSDVKSKSKKEVIGVKNKDINSSKTTGNQISTVNEEAGFYVVVESSINRAALEKDVQKWNEKEDAVFVIKSKSSKWYFIAVAKFDDLESSLKALKEFRKKYRKSWVVKQ